MRQARHGSAGLGNDRQGRAAKGMQHCNETGALLLLRGGRGRRAKSHPQGEARRFDMTVAVRVATSGIKGEHRTPCTKRGEARQRREQFVLASHPVFRQGGLRVA